MLNLTERNNLITEFQTPDKCFPGSVYECQKKTLWITTTYHARASLNPGEESQLQKLLHFLPGLSSDLVLKYLNKKQATILGHIQQPRKGLRSTHKKETQSEPEPDPELEPDQFPSSPQSVGTNIFFLKTVDLTGKFYTDQTVLFPITSRKGNKYILVAYYYDSNTIHA